MKHCNGCDLDLPLDAFDVRSKDDPKPRSRCKACRYKKRGHRPKVKLSAVEAKRRHTDYWLRRRYGIDLATYERMHAEQGGRCFLCHREEADAKGRRLHVDHNHTTGAVRRLLCFWCNTRIATVEDGEFMHRAAAYLAAH